MISQADIIRTLVNKNCTDESIMSMALSPNCTPPKLLEKFTEAERFDLALDLSMKLGLDTLPLWKTWAKQCLKNRNFQGAREKFRHCFLRFRASSSRSNTASSVLLNEIVEDLMKMEETKLTLAEEIQLIRQRKSIIKLDCCFEVDSDKSSPGIEIKPKIYAECLYYINEYGNSHDEIRFFIKNALWEQAIKILSDDKKHVIEDKFFILDVVLYLTTTGQLEEFVSAMIEVDPLIITSIRYFKAIYNFCTIHRRFNLLYHIQTRIGDFVAAANNQICYFFLKKPVQSYRELNSRLISLVNARIDYQRYLTTLQQDTGKTNSETSGRDDNDCQKQQTRSSLFSHMNSDEVKQQLKVIDLQIELTRNFAINEVSGCIHGIEAGGIFEDPNEPGDSNNKTNAKSTLNECPVTLFDRTEQRRTFLAALALIYFDVTCSNYFSKSGLDLANQIVEIFGLDKLKVFKTAMRVIIEDESCDILENSRLLLERLKEDYLTTVRTSPLKAITDKKSPRQAKSSAKNKRTNDRLSNNNDSSIANPSPTSASSKEPQPPPRSNSKTITTIGDDDSKIRQKLAGSTASNPAPHLINDSNLYRLPQQKLETTTTANALADGNENSTKSGNSILLNRVPLSNYHMATSNSKNVSEAARMICDEVIRDSIKSCREPDYKMELAKLLSAEAKIELYIELGKLSNAQSLACSMNRPDYVSIIIDEAARLNQDHVKTVCQHWLVKRS